MLKRLLLGAVFSATAQCALAQAIPLLPSPIPAAQMPALTGDVTSSAGSVATTVAKITGPGIIGALKTNGSGTVSQAACADLSNGVASCSTDTTNAANISSGALPAARMPALTGDCTTSAGAIATTCTKTNNVAFGTSATINTGTSGATIPLLNGANTWGGTQTITSPVLTTGTSIGGALGTIATRFAQPVDIVGASNYSGVAITDWAGATTDLSPIIDINRSASSTPGTFTAVAAGNTLGYLSFRGSDGTAFTQAATIRVTVGGAVASNQVPGDLAISTANSSGTVTIRQTFDHQGHIRTTSVPPSSGTPTSCGTGSPTVIGSDNAGLITEGTTASGCTITFTTAFTSRPFCNVNSETQLAAFSYVVSASTIVITNTSGSGALIDYTCTAQAGG